jgi:lipopolysaccharide transport system permease protein
MSSIAARRHEHTRDILWTFFTRDLKVQYKGSLLGVVWSLVYPIVQLIVFGFLFKGVLGVETPRYSVYAFSGILMWSYFSNMINQATHAITGNRELVRQPGFPVTVLPVTVLFTASYQMLVALPVLLACLVIEGVPLGLHCLAIIPIIAVQALLMLGLSYLLGSANVVFRDVQHIVSVLLQVAMFVSPVFWEKSVLPARFVWIYDLNPMASLLDAYRAALLHDTAPAWDRVGVIGALSAALLFVSHRWFVRMSHRFAEEL